MSRLGEFISVAKNWVKRELLLNPEQQRLARIQQREREQLEWKAFVDDWMAGQPQNPYPNKSPEWIAEEERIERAFSDFMFEQRNAGQPAHIVAFNRRAMEHGRQVMAAERAFWNGTEGQHYLTDPRAAFKQAWLASEYWYTGARPAQSHPEPDFGGVHP